ncbi:hypothetical protein KGY79_13905, partial [Candidatus Bipolaricaulota bacterium]|nr:hypothetical protein [Candidatus Bipolaricaulota bacterium]
MSIVKESHKDIFLLGLILFCGLFLISNLAFAKSEEAGLTGNWSTDLYLYPGISGSDIFDIDTTISLTYNYAGIELTSLTEFSDRYPQYDFYRRQNFGLGTRIGILELNSDVVFTPEEQRLKYWLSRATTTFAGFTITQNFLVEYLELPELFTGLAVSPGPGYGAGVELVINGKTPEGLAVEVSSRFGMEESWKEQQGIEAGSGYDIITYGAEGPYTYSPSDLQYVSSTLEVSNFSLGCCEYDITTWFSREKGFEYSQFEFFFESENSPISIGTDLIFYPDKKTVSIDPDLKIDGKCFDLYMDFREKDSSSTYDLQFNGFGVQGVEVGKTLTLSSITTFRKGLYKNVGTNDINLSASDYIVEPLTFISPHYNISSFYEGPLNYDQVFSITSADRNGLSTLGLDFYFDMSNTD